MRDTRGYSMRLVDKLYALSRWAIGGLFIYAGSVKLLEPSVFAVLIDAFGIVPGSLLRPLAVGLPVLEVTAGVAILFDIEGSLAVIAGLLALFLVILGCGIQMGLDIDCGCFGPQDPEARAFHGLRTAFYRDLVMLAGVSCMYGWRRFRGIQPVKLAPLTINRIIRGRG